MRKSVSLSHSIYIGPYSLHLHLWRCNRFWPRVFWQHTPHAVWWGWQWTLLWYSVLFFYSAGGLLLVVMDMSKEFTNFWHKRWLLPRQGHK